MESLLPAAETQENQTSWNGHAGVSLQAKELCSSDSRRSCRERLADTCRHWINPRPRPQPQPRPRRTFWQFIRRDRQVAPGSPAQDSRDGDTAVTPTSQPQVPSVEDAKWAVPTALKTKLCAAEIAAEESACAPAALEARMAESSSRQILASPAVAAEEPALPCTHVDLPVDVCTAVETDPAPPEAAAEEPQSKRAVLRVVVYLPRAHDEDTCPSEAEDAEQPQGSIDETLNEPLPASGDKEHFPLVAAENAQQGAADLYLEDYSSSASETDCSTAESEDEEARLCIADPELSSVSDTESIPPKEEDEEQPQGKALFCWHQKVSLSDAYEENTLPPVDI
ncbi:uncharacterized protein [Dipodomys merriami]|uniref:uncharacterized protein n=1 Tax=Dipodomys merriami TaxID=94247 RepID=UPI0038558A86